MAEGESQTMSELGPEMSVTAASCSRYDDDDHDDDHDDDGGDDIDDYAYDDDNDNDDNDDDDNDNDTPASTRPSPSCPTSRGSTRPSSPPSPLRRQTLRLVTNRYQLNNIFSRTILLL